tara:strand:- start:1830 stop:2825 length:996 start_codon:yes stop_codon:yes gene_type:complete
VNILSSSQILIRADGNSMIGLGHLARCSGLLNALLTKGVSSVLLTEDNEVSGAFLRDQNSVIYENRSRLTDVSNWPPASMYIVDLYDYDPALYLDLKRNNKCVIYIYDDENHVIPDGVDGVINPNIYANDNEYPGVQALCGMQYYVFREEIIHARKQCAPEEDYVFVCMGGSDPEQMTSVVATAISEVSEKSIVAVLGDPDEIQMDRLMKIRNLSLHIRPSDFASLMTGARYAVTGAGSIAYELAYLRKPMILIQLAENQKMIAESFGKQDGVVNLGDFRCFSNKTIQEAVAEVESGDNVTAKIDFSLGTGGAERLAEKLLFSARNMDEHS